MAEGPPQPNPEGEPKTPAPGTPEAPPTPPPPPVEKPEVNESLDLPEPPPAPRMPPRRRSIWDKIFRRNIEENPHIDPAIRQYSEVRQKGAFRVDEARRAGRMLNPRNIELVNRPDELIQAYATELENAAVWRARDLEQRYGNGPFGQYRALLEGELDFEMNENGSMRRNACNEIIRKALTTVFNRKTAIAGGLALAIGMCTGGIGVPAAGALFGSMVGRGVAEAWQSICERREEREAARNVQLQGDEQGLRGGLRGEIARAQYQDWCRLHEMALSCQEQGTEPEERNRRIAALIDGFYQSNEKVQEREKEILEEQERWNRVKNTAGMIGGIAGGFAGGIAVVKLGQLMNMHIHGLHIAGQNLPPEVANIPRQVEKINGVWHSLYHSAQEAASAAQNGATIVPGGAHGAHLLGESTGQVVWGVVKNVFRNAAPLAGVFGGLWLGRVSEKGSEANRKEELERLNARTKRNQGEARKFLREQVPGGGGKGVERPENEAGWKALFEKFGKPFPSIGEVWIISSGVSKPIMLKITSIDWESGHINATLGNEQGKSTGSYPLDELLTNGKRQQEFVADWNTQFAGGEIINIENSNIVDIRGLVIPAGKYEAVPHPKNPDQIILRKEGQADIIASSLILAFLGINRFEEGQEEASQEDLEAEIDKLAPKNRFRLRRGKHLPEKFADLPEMFTITRIDKENGEIHIADAKNKENTDTISFADWKVLMRLFRKSGEGEAQVEKKQKEDKEGKGSKGKNKRSKGRQGAPAAQESAPSQTETEEEEDGGEDESEATP